MLHVQTVPDSHPSRRQLLGALGALAFPFAGCQDGGGERQTPTPVTDRPADAAALSDLSVGLSTVVEGLVAPIGLEEPVDGRRFLVDQAGRIHLLTGGARHTFLDLTDHVEASRGYEERGLLGLAFHPAFASNGRFYLRYSAPTDGSTPAGYSHVSVLSEFEVDPHSTTADPDTERRLLTVPQPQPNHNGGDVLFGPDGYLYVGLGDGGGAGDAGLGHVEDWYDPVSGGNGQDVTENLLGSVLRIDVDDCADGTGYAVPEDNPLVGSEGLDEHYAWGFRNPWGLSFGPAGNLYVADAGQHGPEEVNVERGGNYGWNVREGTRCVGGDSCPTAADGTPLSPPVVEYSEGGGEVSGISIVGGYLYDGAGLSSLDGLYVFADWRVTDELYAARPTGGGLWETAPVSVDGDLKPHALGFGCDAEGELYLCTNQRGRLRGTSGTVYRLVPA